jgi:hypothetical protein
MNVKEKMKFAYSLCLAIVKSKRYLHYPSEATWVNSVINGFGLGYPRVRCVFRAWSLHWLLRSDVSRGCMGGSGGGGGRIHY